MSLPDDSSLTPLEYRNVRKEAERALKESGAYGVFPTPVDAIMSAANITEVKEDILSPSFIDKLRKEAVKFGDILKRAASKVLGIFHAPSGLVFLDRSVLKVRRRFISLHESGHGFMPWQRAMYAHVEESEKSLTPGPAELFDREANVFATEVLFQLDHFHKQAEEYKFGLRTPIDLAKKYDASIYASIRQYVSKNTRNCAVVVLNMPKFAEEMGYCSSLRRFVQSESFTNMFGKQQWKSIYTPDDPLGAMVPLAISRSSGQRTLAITDLNGIQHECIAEAFTNTYQVFVLLYPSKEMTASRIIMPAA